MKIAFDGRFLEGHPHSRLVHTLLRQNAIEPYASQFVLYVDRAEARPALEARFGAPNLEIKVLGPCGGRIARLRWLWLSVPKALVRDNASVFYSSFYFLPPTVKGVRLFNSIHDCCVFYINPALNRGLLSNPAYLWVLKRAMQWTSRRATATITVSNFSKCMLHRHLGLEPAAVRVCSHGIDAAPSFNGDTRIPRPTPGCEPYFLFVGTNLPKKNIRQCIAGFARLPLEIRNSHRLLLKTTSYPEDLAQIAGLGIGKRVQFLEERLDAAEMASLFLGASLLLLLSYDEGFGLPIIEAFAAGVPVLVSERSACGEIVTMPECKADPDNLDEIVAKWALLVDDPELRDRCLLEQGRLLPRFSQRTAADTFHDAVAN
jgi:glycosyltransferase involved in cell wall biosynthesis